MEPAKIVVLSTIAFKEALIELIPDFEHESMHKIDVAFAGGPITATKVREGAAGDLFIGPSEFSDALLAEGKLVAGSRTPFAISGSAVAVRSGAPHPDISTESAFKQTLLAAESVAYSRGASGIQFLQILERLGIAEAVKAKHVAPQPGELVGKVLVRGGAEIGVQQLSELLPVAGIDILGPLPKTLQVAIVYAARVLREWTEREAAQQCVRVLRSRAGDETIRKKGMEPAP